MSFRRVSSSDTKNPGDQAANVHSDTQNVRRNNSFKAQAMRQTSTSRSPGKPSAIFFDNRHAAEIGVQITAGVGVDGNSGRIGKSGASSMVELGWPRVQRCAIVKGRVLAGRCAGPAVRKEFRVAGVAKNKGRGGRHYREMRPAHSLAKPARRQNCGAVFICCHGLLTAA